MAGVKKLRQPIAHIIAFVAHLAWHRYNKIAVANTVFQGGIKIVKQQLPHAENNIINIHSFWWWKRGGPFSRAAAAEDSAVQCPSRNTKSERKE